MLCSGENHAIVDNENSKVVEKLVKSTKIEIAEVGFKFHLAAFSNI